MALSGRQEKRLLSSALFDGCETQSYRPMVQALSPTSILKGQQIDALPPNGSALGFLLDGCLDLCVVSGSSRLRLTFLLLASLFGKHIYCNGVRTYTCREVSIHTDLPLLVHADGESCYGQTDISIRCEEKKLRFIC